MKKVQLAKRKHVKVTDTGWGNELEIHNGDGYCGRVLTVNKVQQSSYHYHIKKNETFYVLEGALKVELSFDLHSKHTVLYKGDCIDIPRFVLHRFTGIKDATVLEISTYDEGEDDIVRVESGDNQDNKVVPLQNKDFEAWEKKVNRILGK